LKICMLTSSFPRFKGDPAGIFIYELCSALSRRDVDIEVVCPHDNGYRTRERWGRISIHRYPYFFPRRHQTLCYGAGILKNINRNGLAPVQLPFFLVMGALYSFLIAREKQADLIHAHWSLPQGLMGIAGGRLSGIPCVTTVHGSDVYGLRHPLFKILNSMVIRHSDACTANSTATARKVREISGRKDIEIIPMGFDPEVFTPLDSRNIPGPKREKTLLYVGRLIDWKGVDSLIKALPLVQRRFPETRLLLIGDGPQRAELMGLCRDLGIEESVKFMGEIPQDLLPEYYSSAQAFVLPSIVNEKGETEGLGLVLLEAMACGTPVIGSDVGGIPDIIKNGNTGLLAKPRDPEDLADKIMTVMADKKLAEELSSRASRYITENFSWDSIADRFLKLYQRTLMRTHT